MTEGNRTTQGIMTGKELDIAIANLLRKAGVPAHILGYDYLMEAIKLSYTDKNYIHNMTTMLYPEIAKAFGTTASRLERAIRHAVEVAFERGDIEFINANFSYDQRKGKATNAEFIAGAVVYIKNHY